MSSRKTEVSRQNGRAVAGAVMLLVLAGAAMAGLPDTSDRTLSPYFMVKSDDPTADALPLLSTSAAVDVAGVIADVRVTQVYKNAGRRPIEAVYTFPASTRAAVYAMRMTIGRRTIVARIQEREQARQNYNQAVQNGQTASLLEQQRPNVFQMNVGNIMPGDTIRVEMSYTELLVPTDGLYEFAYPTVVGPRYSNQPAATAPETDRWVQSPYQHQGEAPLYQFDIGVNIAAGMPIQEITCTSHRTSVAWQGQNSARVRLEASERDGGNRDFILKYRLAGGAIQSGLLLYEGNGEKFFLAMVQPPRRVETRDVPRREYVFIVDVSGSMYGFPLDVSKKLLKELISSLRPSDCFNVLFFAGGNSVLAEQSLAATPENIARAVRMLEEQEGSGGTELLPALRRALALPRTEGTSRIVVIATDGYVTVEPEAFDLVRQSLGKANMFAFGIGSSVNRFLIEGLARAGMGEPFVIEDQEHAPAAADKFRQYVRTPVLTGVTVDCHGFQAYDVEPQSVPDVMAERPIIVFGKYRGGATGTIVIRGSTPSRQWTQTLNLADYRPAAGNAALRYLWARQRVQLLADYAGVGRADSAQVVALGLKYNLLTQYTSFVAIDTRVRNDGGSPAVVRQPLPLPQGVSDYAVGRGLAGACSGGYGVPLARVAAVSRWQCEAAVPCEAYFADVDESTQSSVPAPGVTLAEVRTGQGVAESQVRAALDSLLPAIEAEFRGGAPTPGSLMLRFKVAPDGSVRSVLVVQTQVDPVLAEKVRRLLAGLTLPNSSGREVVVSVRLEFVR